MTELVHFEVRNGVGTITLDSPHNRNALSRQLTEELAGHMEAAIADPEVRAIVLTATGTVFCSGADLKEQREANQGGGNTGPTSGRPGAAPAGRSPRSWRPCGTRRSPLSGESTAPRGRAAWDWSAHATSR